jgi:hypothetical protein
LNQEDGAPQSLAAGVSKNPGSTPKAVSDMRSLRALMLSSLALALLSCASPYQVVQLPEREADLYPISQTRDEITIAIDEIMSAQRGERYFGGNLIREGILPVAVVVSNYGAHRIIVKPSDILVHRGSEIVDPLPIETVTAIAKNQHWFLRSTTEKEVESYFKGLAFKETVLMHEETYQGVIFFPVPRPERSSDTLFTMLRLFGDGRLQVHVAARDLEAHNRLLFGPFWLSVPEDTSD